MAMQLHSLLLYVVLLFGFALANTNALHCQKPSPPIDCPNNLNRAHFDSLVPHFIFGAASSAYQVEGAANEDGRGPSIWDFFTHNHPEKIDDQSNGDVAIDEYHRYKEDVGIMKNMSMEAYRFSISWSRVLPRGTGQPNPKGIKYYNNLINELLKKGMKPYVTLFHWDVPQALQEKYGGFLSPHIVDDFRAYAELCYKEFGDRVRHWMTVNEPYTVSNHGYTIGLHAPGRCSYKYDHTCLGGDSATEPYLVTHHQLLAHAAAVKLYKDKYQALQKGVIGITLNTHWFEPASKAKHDIDAAFRALDFMFGWYMDPLTNGDYPPSMRFLVGKRLPKFTNEESKLLKGSYDFIGVNYYSARYASAYPADYIIPKPPSYLTDAYVNVTTDFNGVPIGPKAASNWLYIYPKGLYDLILYTKKMYNDPIMYITENGVDEFDNPKVPLQMALKDSNRIYYYYHHLCYLQAAIKEGANVQGYFAWSLLDNFEWSSGYTMRFGINYVDYANGLKRHPKDSTYWFQSFLKSTQI
ncbi:beta-glucosidase 12-like [Prunus dulcis]|uniref:beta-glucosidase 12-like n=1 Tax=Prunus dulcis TaxID=3755 RepID=UPI001483B577|nr:beta-glucosidase 12-like [Prunus dulcis]